MRGVRSVSDLEYEQQAAQMNAHLSGDIDTVFLLTNPRYAFVSSSGVKELVAFGGNLDGLVPPCVKEAVALRQDKSIE